MCCLKFVCCNDYSGAGSTGRITTAVHIKSLHIAPTNQLQTVVLHTYTTRRLHLIRDSGKEKPLELEMGWLCAETGFKHAMVPKELVLASDAAGKAAAEGGATLTTAAVEEKTMEVVE